MDDYNGVRIPGRMDMGGVQRGLGFDEQGISGTASFDYYLDTVQNAVL